MRLDLISFLATNRAKAWYIVMLCLRFASRRNLSSHVTSLSYKYSFKSVYSNLNGCQLGIASLLPKSICTTTHSSGIRAQHMITRRELSSSSSLTDDYLAHQLQNRRYPRAGVIQVEIVNYFESITQESDFDLPTIVHFFRSFGSRESYVELDAYLPRISKFLVESENSIIELDIVNLCYGLSGWTRLDDSTHKMDIVNVICRRLNQLLVESPRSLQDSTQLSMMLYGLRGKSAVDQGIQLLLPQIGAHLRKVSRLFDVNSIAMSLHGIKEMDPSDPTVTNLLNSLVPLVEKATGQLTKKTLPMTLGALQSLKCDLPATHRIMRGLLRFINVTKAMKLDGVSLSITLQGMLWLISQNPKDRYIFKEMKTLMEAPQMALPPHDLSLILRGFKNMRVADPEVSEMISAIIPSIKSCNEAFDQRDIAFALSGMSSMDSSLPVVRDLLSALLPLFVACPNQHFQNEKLLSMALNGLVRMSNDQSEVVQLLQILIPMIDGCGLKLSAFALSSALFGLQSMDCQSPEVLKLLKAMTPLVASCDEQLSAELAVNCLYCLRRLDSSHQEVKPFLLGLIPKIVHCHGQLSGTMISNFAISLQRVSIRDTAPLWRFLTNSLRNLGNIDQLDTNDVTHCVAALTSVSENSPEIREYMLVLAGSISPSLPPFDSHQLGTIVSGFERIAFERTESKQLLSALLPSIRRCQGEISPALIGKILFGLQSLGKMNDDIRELLNILARLFKNCNANFDVKSLIRAVYGFKNMNASEKSVRGLIQAVTPFIPNSQADQPLTSWHLSKLMLGLQTLTSGYSEVQNLIAALEPHIASCQVLELRHVSDTIFGLRYLSTENECVRAILRHLARLLGTCEGKVRPDKVPYVIAGLKRLSTEYEEVRELIRMLLPILPHPTCSKVELRKMNEHTKFLNSQYPEVKQLFTLLSLVK